MVYMSTVKLASPTSWSIPSYTTPNAYSNPSVETDADLFSYQTEEYVYIFSTIGSILLFLWTFKN